MSVILESSPALSQKNINRQFATREAIKSLYYKRIQITNDTLSSNGTNSSSIISKTKALSIPVNDINDCNDGNDGNDDAGINDGTAVTGDTM